MKNITEQFNTSFQPFKVLLLYRHDREANISQFGNTPRETQIYVESYDIGRNGQPVNAHPLTIKEMTGLSEILKTSQDLKDGYLKSKGLLPANLLYVNQQTNGNAIWYTPPTHVDLYFVESLDIRSGKCGIPGMVWKANAEKLSVFAVRGKTKPNLDTLLYHAPYLNIYHNGAVCMGTVSIHINQTTSLEDFMDAWESYFFNSYFSHSISGNNSTKSNTTDLWRKLSGAGKDFPQQELLKTPYTLKSLL